MFPFGNMELMLRAVCLCGELPCTVPCGAGMLSGVYRRRGKSTKLLSPRLVKFTSSHPASTVAGWFRGHVEDVELCRNCWAMETFIAGHSVGEIKILLCIIGIWMRTHPIKSFWFINLINIHHDNPVSRATRNCEFIWGISVGYYNFSLGPKCVNNFCRILVLIIYLLLIDSISYAS